MNVELLLEEKVENLTDLDFNVFKRQTLKTSKVNSNTSDKETDESWDIPYFLE